MRNSFLEKSYTKCSGETIRRLFFLKINVDYVSGLKFYTVFFFFFVYQVEHYQNILKLSCRTLKNGFKESFFKKNRKRSGSSFSDSLSA